MRETPAATRRPRPRDGIGNATLAFFEAYFSNFIEGTEFEVEEAAEIVFAGRIPHQRPADAYDILGVWGVVSDQSEMRRIPATGEELVDQLRSRHATALGGRPEATPGRFKTAPNRVGAMTFVAPDAVLGTLDRGFDIYRGLVSPFHRAAFIHFLISEVHPFADGNGRLARIMMNAELISANEERVVIPIVYRDNYIAAQRALSVGHSALPMLRMLDSAWRWTAAMDWGRLDQTTERLRACNAFDTETVAEQGRGAQDAVSRRLAGQPTGEQVDRPRCQRWVSATRHRSFRRAHAPGGFDALAGRGTRISTRGQDPEAQRFSLVCSWSHY